MMERYTFLLVLTATIILVAVGIFVIPGQEPGQAVRLPWQIERVDGTIRVFGLTLGRSTLADAEAVIGEEAEVSLFRSPEGVIDIEAYFDQATISGLKSKMVVEVGLSEPEKKGMYDRGIRIATMGSGTRKVTLAPGDLASVRQAPISTLTYIPQTNLEPELLTSRFGEAAEKIPEPESDAVHWLYPDLGLDVALHEKAKEVLQYVPPSEFERIAAPLRQGAENH